MNTLPARIRAFFRSQWIELLLAFPACLAAPMVYRALSVFFMPSDRGAAARFDIAVSAASADIEVLTFAGVIAFVALRWRARNPHR